MAGETTTDTQAATNTEGGSGSSAAANGEGAGTGSATQVQAQEQQGGNNQQQQTQAQDDPEVKAALALLEKKGQKVYTQNQFNGHMTAARTKWEGEQRQAAADAAAEATRKAQEEQGQFKPLYEELKPKYDGLVTENQQLQQRVAQMETERAAAENKAMDEAIEGWPEDKRNLAKAYDPGKDNLEARRKWFETAQKQIGTASTKTKPVWGTGFTPPSSGSGTTNLAAQHINRTYKPAANQQGNAGGGGGK